MRRGPGVRESPVRTGSIGVTGVCFLAEESHCQGWARRQQVGLSYCFPRDSRSQGKWVLPVNLGLGVEGGCLVAMVIV